MANGILISGAHITWAKSTKDGNIEFRHKTEDPAACLETIKEKTATPGDLNHPVTLCILNDPDNHKDVLEARLKKEGADVHVISPGNALGMAHISQYPDLHDTALVCFHDYLYGALIFNKKIFSFRESQDSLFSQKMIIPQFKNKPISVAKFFNANNIVSEFFEKTGRQISVNEIAAEFSAEGYQDTHPFYVFHDFFTYLITNINYSFDPTEVVYCGNLFTQSEPATFNDLWATPVRNKIIGDNPEISFSCRNINEDMFLTGACLYSGNLSE